MNLPFTSPAAVFFTVFLVILVAPLVSERLRIPGIVGLVIGGLIVGPTGFGLLPRDGLIEQLGGAGILYLMFLAGLELDVNAMVRRRREMAVLSAATFAFPLTLGVLAGAVTGYAPLATVLLGSLWASHTLIAYPLVRRYGLQRSRAVATTVAATVVTDTLALLVLAVVVQLHLSGRFSVSVVGELVGGVVVLAFGTLLVLPRLIRWLLRGIGQDRPIRVLLFLLGAFAGALLAELVGIEGIIGSFLMGLSLNRLVPRDGVVLERLELLGTGLLIPVFLMSVGMLVDVELIAEPRTLLLGAVFTVAAIVGKGGAALVAGRFSRFNRDEIAVTFSLSAAQAAATLAATIVGFDVGLFDDETVHAVLIVILVTVVLASWVAQRVMPRLAVVPPTGDIGERVLVPVANPAHAETHVQFAARLASPDRGIVMPLHVVVDPSRGRSALDAARSWLAGLEAVGYRSGVEAHAQLRLDASVARGVARSVDESAATLLIVGWSADRSFAPLGTSRILDEMIARSAAPVAVVLETGRPSNRVILALADVDLAPGAATVLSLAVAVATKLGRGVRSRLILAPDDTGDLAAVAIELGRPELCFDPASRLEALGGLVRPGDIVVVPATDVGSGAVLHEFDDIVAAIAQVTLVAVFAPHAASSYGPERFGVVRVDRSVDGGDDRQFR